MRKDSSWPQPFLCTKKRWKGLRPISANLFGMSFFKTPIKIVILSRAPPQIYRVTQRLVARSRRTPKVLTLPMLFEAFDYQKPEIRILLQYPFDGHGYIFSCAAVFFDP